MFCSIFTFAAIPPVPANRFLIPAALIMAIVSIARRSQAIGGWLLYFYYWICVFLLVFVADIALHPTAFFSRSLKPDLHLALIMATVPRLIAGIVLVTVAFLMANRREWIWVERVRFCMIITVMSAGISVVIDYYYFPRSVFLNVIRLCGLISWTLYFFFSRRVRDVFLTKTWEAEHAPRTLSTTGGHGETK